MIQREIGESLSQRMGKGKVIMLIGPRQVGKTTIIRHLLSNYSGNYQEFTGDDSTTRALFSEPKLEILKQVIGNSNCLFIDEAQRIPNIGTSAKLIVDNVPNVQLILSGSSAFELTQKVHEPLTGRKYEYQLWPISFKEWQNHVGYLKASQDIENRLVLGYYPEVLNQPEQARAVLKELVNSYLFKDVLQYSGIRKADVIMKLIAALAHQ
ncbi:MAG: AAA family ATPase, partial [Bacteroidetes bacterium]|nr:AAA family ATPase [Bacteroidota bacterium]